jgi:hypothetical protein
VYAAQNYWGSGLCPSSRIKKQENDVSEAGSVSVLRWREDDVYCVGSLTANLNHWTRSSFRNFVFPSSQDSERRTKPRSPVMLSRNIKTSDMGRMSWGKRPVWDRIATDSRRQAVAVTSRERWKSAKQHREVLFLRLILAREEDDIRKEGEWHIVGWSRPATPRNQVSGVHYNL